MAESTSRPTRVRADHLRSALVSALAHVVDVEATQEGFPAPIPFDRDSDDTIRMYVEIDVTAERCFVRGTDRITCLQIALTPDAVEVGEAHSIVLARDEVKLLIWALSASREEWISFKVIDTEDGSLLDVQLAKGTRRPIEEIQVTCLRGVGVFEFAAFFGMMPTEKALSEPIAFHPRYLGRFAAAVREYSTIGPEDDEGGAWYSFFGPNAVARVDIPARRKDRLGSEIIGAVMPTTL